MESVTDGDFQEEDVWDLLNEHKDHKSPKAKQTIEPSDSTQRFPLIEPSDSIQRFRPTAAKMIQRIPKQSRGMVTMRQNSAPVNIPDWSQIEIKKSMKSGYDYDDDVAIDDYDDVNLGADEFFLARSQSQSSSLSVTVGSGRTLRGRDLRRVRNAVLKQTGFLE